MRYLLILFALCIAAFAEGITLTPAMEAKFVQKITHPNKSVERYEGILLMDNSSRFKWSYTKPLKKEICSDGSNLIVVDNDLQQVSLYHLVGGFDLSSILKRAKHYKDRLYLASYKGRNYTIALDSKGIIEQIAYRDEHDNIVNIHLYKVKRYTKALPIERFNCPYPKNYDLIKG